MAFATHDDIVAYIQSKAGGEEQALSLETAKKLDQEDDVCRRELFCIPVSEPSDPKSPPSLYMCGNSLGLQPRSARTYVLEEMDRWALGGVRGHFEGEGRHWAKIDDYVQAPTAAIVGALPHEVCVMNSLTVNLHLLFVPFYHPTPERYKIIMEARAFPSDRYLVESQVRFHGFNPDDAIVLLEPRPGEACLDDEEVLAAVDCHGGAAALVFLPGVHYYTGQALDVAAVARRARDKGCRVGFDLAHAAGNLELRLHDWDVDFASWCSYKYLNAGPGGIAGAFIHERHHADPSLRRWAGWWGHDPSTRFDMTQPYSPDVGARGFQLSNPPILQTVSLLASLEIFGQVGMAAVRRKSLLLTGYLLLLLDRRLGPHVRVITPREPARRGAQLSLIVDRPVKPVFEALAAAGVVCDMREPDVIRVAPAPLYNTFEEVHRLVELLVPLLP